MRWTKLWYAISVAVVLVILMYMINVLSNINIRLDKIEKNVDTLKDNVDTLGKLVRTGQRLTVSLEELHCLTKNIYYEAGNQDSKGKFAVAHVTLNRLQHGYWGTDLCKVVYSPSQFSWTKIKKLPKPHPDLWNHCKMIAIESLMGTRVAGLERSLFYHADYIPSPKWAVNDHQIGKIGNHIFYTRAKSSWIEL